MADVGTSSQNTTKYPASRYKIDRCADKLVGFFKGVRDRAYLKPWTEKPEVPKNFAQSERNTSDRCFTTLLLEYEDAQSSVARSEYYFPLKCVEQYIGLVQSQNTPVVVILGGINPVNKRDVYAAGNVFLRYDPVKNSMMKFSMMPVPRHHHQAVYSDSHIYIIGGYDPRLTFERKLVATATCFKYNVKTYIWTRIADINTARVYHGAVVLKNQIYVVGGKNHQGRLLNSVEMYDAKEDRWIILESGICCPRMGMGCAVFKGKIWLAGGMTHPPQSEDNVCSVKIVEVYDPNENQWHVVDRRVPYNMVFPKLCATGSSLLLIGGATIEKENKLHISSMPFVFRYNEEDDQWMEEGRLQSARHDPAVTPLFNSIFVVGGCSTASMSVVNDIEMYDIVKNISTKIQNLPISFTGSAVLTLPKASDI